MAGKRDVMYWKRAKKDLETRMSRIDAEIAKATGTMKKKPMMKRGKK